MTTKLVPYELSSEKQELLQQCFSSPPHEFLPQVCDKRPKPSDLRNRITGELSLQGLNTRHELRVMELVLRSVHQSWENFHEGSVSSNEFMRTPFGAPYEVVNIAGKGRGLIASRDIKVGETILQDTPVLVLPPSPANMMIFLTLPRKALEAILLLHNQKPDLNSFATLFDVPVHRLMDMMQGITDTNSFAVSDAAEAAYGSGIGVLLLTGSLFNHSDTPNVEREWDVATEKMVFTSLQDIKKGDELEISYVPIADDGIPFADVVRAELLKEYGL